MPVVGLQTSIWSNRLKTIYLIMLLPLVVFLGILFGYYILSLDNINLDFNLILSNTFSMFLYSLPFIFLWLIIGIKFQKSIIFKFSGAKEITRKQNPEIYNIVENLSISRGIQTPKVGILDDDSLNAFATGWGKDKSWIVFSRGLLNKLDKKEIEAVAAHEMTHILNDDIKIMVISTVFIGIIGTIGQILLRTAFSSSRSSNKKGGNPLPLFGLILYIISLIIMPLILLAISRKREYLADAGSVELTGDNLSMISALQKISNDSRIESISKDGVAAMCIANPFKKTGFISKMKSLISSHPSIDDRINVLKIY